MVSYIVLELASPVSHEALRNPQATAKQKTPCQRIGKQWIVSEASRHAFLGERE